jgi:hypothetical protein
MIAYRKVGGIHFVRVWRLRFSFCMARREECSQLRWVKG